MSFNATVSFIFLGPKLGWILQNKHDEILSIFTSILNSPLAKPFVSPANKTYTVSVCFINDGLIVIIYDGNSPLISAMEDPSIIKY